jgi:hypothetical protein
MPSRVIGRCAALMMALMMMMLVMAAGCTASRRADSPQLGATGRTTPIPTPAEALDRGVTFLIEHQNPDGSWGSFESARPGEIYLGTTASHRAFRDASSALCVMALIEPSRTDAEALAALERGLDFLLATPPVTRATGDTFYDTWTHTYLVESLSLISRDERFADRRPAIESVVRREIEILCERQAAEGGWGYYDFGWARPTPTGDQSTSFNTASALLAFHAAREAGFAVPQHTIDDALTCLERLRLPSGAYVYGTYAQLNPGALYNYVKGSLGRSQPCNLALHTYEKGVSRDDLLAGMNNFREFHHFIEIGKGRPYPHEAWYFTAGYYFLYGHWYAARVIDELESQEMQRDFRGWLAQTIARLQDPDGSWFDFPLYGYHRFYGTAFAVMTLQRCLGQRAGDPSAESLVKVATSF